MRNPESIMALPAFWEGCAKTRYELLKQDNSLLNERGHLRALEIAASLRAGKFLKDNPAYSEWLNK